MLKRLKDQHAALIAMADEIIAIARAADPSRLDQLGRTRLRFARALIEHFDEENAFVRDAQARGAVDRHAAERRNTALQFWRADMAVCNSAWSATRILEQPDAFLAEFEILAAGLRHEAAHEEQEILALAERARVVRHAAVQRAGPLAS